jgi:hypothetical protein
MKIYLCNPFFNVFLSTPKEILNHPKSSPQKASEVARCTPAQSNREAFIVRSFWSGVEPGNRARYLDKSTQRKNPAFEGT